MKKILEILLVRRTEIQNKWWDRLINVLMYGTTIIIAIISFSFLSDLSVKKYVHYTYTAYNFENNYSTNTGKEVGCIYGAYSIVCGDVAIQRSDIITPKNTLKQLIDYSKANPASDIASQLQQAITSGAYDQQAVDEGVDLSWAGRPVPTDQQLKEGKIINLLRENKDVKIKQETEILYPSLFKDMTIIILITLTWFIFWQSIIYRTFVYIIYGKKK